MRWRAKASRREPTEKVTQQSVAWTDHLDEELCVQEYRLESRRRQDNDVKTVQSCSHGRTADVITRKGEMLSHDLRLF